MNKRSLARVIQLQRLEHVTVSRAPEQVAFSRSAITTRYI